MYLHFELPFKCFKRSFHSLVWTFYYAKCVCLWLAPSGPVSEANCHSSLDERCSMKPPLATCLRSRGRCIEPCAPQLKDNLLRCRRRLLWISKLAEAKSTRSANALSLSVYRTLSLFLSLSSFVSRSIESGGGVADVWGKCLGHNCSRLGRVIDTLMRRQRLGVCNTHTHARILLGIVYAKRR